MHRQLQEALVVVGNQLGRDHAQEAGFALETDAAHVARGRARHQPAGVGRGDRPVGQGFRADAGFAEATARQDVPDVPVARRRNLVGAAIVGPVGFPVEIGQLLVGELRQLLLAPGWAAIVARSF